MIEFQSKWILFDNKAGFRIIHDHFLRMLLEEPK